MAQEFVIVKLGLMIRLQQNRVWIGVSCSVILLAACSSLQPIDSAKPDPASLKEVPGDPSQLPQPVSILELSEEIKAMVDQHVNRAWPPKKKLDTLRKLIFAEDMLDLKYDISKTRTAIETFESSQGNCLSMTNLFIAMARYADLEAKYHMVPTFPRWDASANTMIWNEHINATGQLGFNADYVLDFVPEPIAVLHNRDKTVSDKYALALYYNNLGAEALVSGDNQAALTFLRVALAVNPDLAKAWNNIAMVQRRFGRTYLMEASLLQTLQLDNRHYTAMSNLAGHYEQIGTTKAAAYYSERVIRYRETNLFYLYARGTSALQEGNYKGAIKSLRKAIRLARDRPEFYLALHQAYELADKKESSERNLALALYYQQNPGSVRNRNTVRVTSDPDADRFLGTPSIVIYTDQTGSVLPRRSMGLWTFKNDLSTIVVKSSCI